jgi:hypothetical protein
MMGIYGTCITCNINHGGSCKEVDILKYVISQYQNLYDDCLTSLGFYDEKYETDYNKVTEFYQEKYLDKY